MSFSWTRWVGIIVKEFIQLKRDRLTFGMILGIPALQLLLFGFAINMDIRNIDTAFVDEARTAHSREIIATLEATGLMAPRAPVRGTPPREGAHQPWVVRTVPASSSFSFSPGSYLVPVAIALTKPMSCTILLDGVSQYSAFSTLIRSKARLGSSRPSGNQALSMGFHSSSALARS